MRVFKVKLFHKWAEDEGISDEDLCQAAREVNAGIVEADLGGYLFKKRVARKGGGKSGGFRTILGLKKGNSDRIFFLYGFSKSDRSTITSKEHDVYSMLAEGYVKSTDSEIDRLIKKYKIIEIQCNQ